jgi:16S rRNA (cytosine967-C5)-methyltransferase
VDAADLHAEKLARLGAGPAGRAVRETFGVDWTRGSGGVHAAYDRILVDAPCSGTGTLRRRPEIAGRLSAADVTRLAALQMQIVRQAARHLRPGGRLVYSVCSLLREEGPEVARALAADLEPAPFDAELPLFAGKSELLLSPAEHGTDGYFIASFTTKSGA